MSDLLSPEQIERYVALRRHGHDRLAVVGAW
jgi:hypothetical protein